MDSKVDYEAVFNALWASLAVLTPDLVVVAANDSYLRATNRTRADLLGRPIFTAFPAKPDALKEPDAPAVDSLRASLERVVATHEPEIMPLVRRDVEVAGQPGVFEERYWNLVNTPVLGPDGEVELVIHRSEDVTDSLGRLQRHRRYDGDAANVPLDDLEIHFYARARELLDLSNRLKQAYRQEQQNVSALQEALEQQQRFLFDASHDLRNPITGLLTELEVALAEPEGADLRKTLRKLHRDAERLNDIVADMLVLARLYTSTPPVPELIDLAQLVVEELESHPPSASVITRLDAHAVVRASRARLARLLSNLMANAERHTTNKIEIAVATEPPDAILEVIDDGPGIAPADRERIFHRLYRRGDARYLDPGGSGFGLPIAREIAHGYGGDLYAADHPTGARFVLRLPLAK